MFSLVVSLNSYSSSTLATSRREVAVLATIVASQCKRSFREYLETMCAENANISGDAVTKLDLDNVSSDQLFRVHVQLLTFADDDRKLSNTALNASTHHHHQTTSVISISPWLFVFFFTQSPNQVMYSYTGWAKKVSLIIFVITLSTASQFS